MADSTNNDEVRLETANTEDIHPTTRTPSFNLGDDSHPQNQEEQKKMVTPTKTSYLSKDGEYSPENGKLPLRVQSTNSLLGLAGLEGHEDDTDDDIDDDYSTTGVSAVTEDQEVMDIVLSPSTRTSMEDATSNTTPPGSVQGPGILSLSPPRLTTYSAGSANSASITANFMIQPRPIQSMQQQYHPNQQSPRYLRSPMVQQPPPRSRPPLVPHPASLISGGNTNGTVSHLSSRPPAGTGPDSSFVAGTAGVGHARTLTDATNYSFLSSLTDASGGEYSLPRRRTLSWDYTRNVGRGGTSMESKSQGGPSVAGSILQPILLSDQEMQASSRPPLSISASNLRKAPPALPEPTITTPLLSSQNSRNGPLPAPSSLPSRENLHPLIEKLQKSSHSRTKSSVESVPLLSLPKSDEKTLHPLIQKFQQSSTSKSIQSKPICNNHLQDEKKDDDTRSSHDIQHQAPPLERRVTDNSSSMCSSTTVSLQKIKATSPNRNLGSTLGSNSRKSGHPRCELKAVLDATKESFVETELIKSIDFIDIDESSSKSSANEDFLSQWWPFFLCVLGVLTIGSRGLSPVWYVVGTSSWILGIVVIANSELAGKFFRGRAHEYNRKDVEYYKKELLLLRRKLILINEIALSRDSATEPINRFQKAIGYILAVLDREPSTVLSKMEGPNRIRFNEASRTFFERLAKRQGQQEISFDRLSRVIKSSDGSTDESKLQMLSELFGSTRQGQVSKLDFVIATDRIYKAALLLIANIENSSRIKRSFEGIVTVMFYTMCLGRCISGVDANTPVWIVLGVFTNVALVLYVTSVEHLKGLFRVVMRLPYNIGDRVHFLEPRDTGTIHDHGDGPPSGGWIVESFDLHTTTLRHGITGECRTISNGSPLLENHRIVCWKPSQRAIVSISWKLAGATLSRRDRIDLVRRQISEWVEARSHEWHGLQSLGFTEVVNRDYSGDAEPRCVAFDIALCHRESWQNYAAVQASKNDFLLFLGELQDQSRE